MKCGERIYTAINEFPFPHEDTSYSVKNDSVIEKNHTLWSKPESSLRANIKLKSGETLFGVTSSEFRKDYKEKEIEYFLNFFHLKVLEDFQFNELYGDVFCL